MSEEFERAKIEAALQQREGMPEDHAIKLGQFHEQQADWFATCQVCGQELRGTLAQMRAHKHDN